MSTNEGPTRIGRPHNRTSVSTSSIPDPHDSPHTVVVTRRVVITNRVVEVECGVCRGGSLSTYGACDLCRDQLAGNTYAKRMRLFAERAEVFHERELRRPYTPFAGVGR